MSMECSLVTPIFSLQLNVWHGRWIYRTSVQLNTLTHSCSYAHLRFGFAPVQINTNWQFFFLSSIHISCWIDSFSSLAFFRHVYIRRNKFHSPFFHYLANSKRNKTKILRIEYTDANYTFTLCLCSVRLCVVWSIGFRFAFRCHCFVFVLIVQESSRAKRKCEERAREGERECCYEVWHYNRLPPLRSSNLSVIQRKYSCHFHFSVFKSFSISFRILINVRATFELHSNTLFSTPINWPDLKTSEKSFVFVHFFFFAGERRNFLANGCVRGL